MEKGRSVKRKVSAAMAMLFPLSMLFCFLGQSHAARQYDFTCRSCHSMPPLDAGSRDADTGGFKGNHQTHLGPGAGIGGCAMCHNAEGYTTGHRDGTIRFQTNINNSPEVGSYVVNGSPVTFRNQTSVPALGACTNVNCHFEHVTNAWGTPVFSSVSDCSACHSTPPTTGSHSQHDISFSWSTNGCAECHPDYRTGLRFSHATSAGNRGIRVTPGTGSYSGAGLYYLPSQKTNPAKEYGNCSNTYCHSDGQSSPAYAPPVPWGGTASTCTSCHGSATTTGSGGSGLSGKHASHLDNPAYFGEGNSYHCVDCHASTVSNDTTISNANLHVNAYVDYSGSRAGGSSHYSRSGKTCTNIYCHSDGAGEFLNPPGWNQPSSPMSCNGCHRNTSASHPAHLAPPVSVGCEACHNQTAASATNLLPGTRLHIDGAGNVVISSQYDGNGVTGNYFSGTRTCSGITCHSNSKGSYQDTTWGTSLTCASCHPNLTGGHARHVGGLSLGSLAFYQYTANRSSGSDGSTVANYGFGCVNCHPADPDYHADGYIQVELNRTAGVGAIRFRNLSALINGSIGTNSITCSNVYCHGDGRASRTTTIPWGSSYSSGDRCARCHGNSPTSGAHTSHVIGIHYDNIFQGYSGLLVPSGDPAVSSSHGDPVQATTINCNLCHVETTDTARNKHNSHCSTCHSGEGDSTGLAKISNLARHVNGKADVSFARINVISKAQLRPEAFAVYSAAGGFWTRNGNNYKSGPAAFDVAKVKLDTATMWDAGNCSNIACHMGRTVNWYGTLSCVDCHSSL